MLLCNFLTDFCTDKVNFPTCTCYESTKSWKCDTWDGGYDTGFFDGTGNAHCVDMDCYGCKDTPRGVADDWICDFSKTIKRRVAMGTDKLASLKRMLIEKLLSKK